MTDQDMTDQEMNAAYAVDGESTEQDDDTARLEADIEATRDEMTGTVEAIGDRLAPSNIVKEATSTVREATVGKVGDMTSTATEALSGAGTTVQETGSGILETIKQNPIPAAMAGIGIAWLWTHRADGGMNKFGSMDEWSSRGRTGYGRTGYGSSYGMNTQSWDTGNGGSERWSGGQTSGDQMQSGGIGDKVGDVTDELGRRASDVGDMAGRVPSQIGGGAQGLARQAQDVMEQSPLAAGAVALAVGAAISMALPATQAERRVIGPTAGQMLGQVESTATDALQKARDTTNA
jgi:hypothetical protein